MKSSFYRIKYGVISLLLIFLCSVVAYRLTGSYGWIDSIWMVVITISTVGFGEQSDTDVTTKLITMAVILFGVIAWVLTIGGFLQMMLEGEVERAFGIRKMNKEIAKLENHVIICGCGRLGKDLAKQLGQRKHQCVIIEQDPDQLDELDPQPLSVIGDALLESTLAKAGIERARSIVAVLSTDADNVFITLTARNMNPEVQILAKCEHHTSSIKLRQAGANKIVMPHQIGARKVERMISRPMTADLMALFDQTTQSEIELDEISVDSGNCLIGGTLKSMDLKNKFDVLVIGIKDSAGKLIFNPPADSEICEGDTLLVMGPYNEVNNLREYCDSD